MIGLNQFVLRQTKESRFSHFNGSMEEICEMVEGKEKVRGYRDGVCSVRVDPTGFRTGVCVLYNEQELKGVYVARTEGETPRKHIMVAGRRRKMAAVQVDIILYRSDVLAENGDNSLEPSEDNWEVVSINASPVEGKTPIAPMTLMHNHFGSDGGTATKMTDEEFVKALKEGFEFWKDKAMCSDR